MTGCVSTRYPVDVKTTEWEPGVMPETVTGVDPFATPSTATLAPAGVDVTRMDPVVGGTRTSVPVAGGV